MNSDPHSVLGSLVSNWLRTRGQSTNLIYCSRRTLIWCALDDLTHVAYRHRLVLRRRTGWRWVCPVVPQKHSWICRKHDQAITRALS